MRVFPMLDRLLVALVFAAAAYLAVRTPVLGKYEILPPGVVTGVAGAAVGVLVAGTLRVARRRPAPLARGLIRGLGWVLGMILLAAAGARIDMQARESRALYRWPPRLAVIRATTPSSISARERAEWGARIIAHRLTSSAGEALSVPADWPFPDDVTIAIRRIDQRVTQIWARASDGTTACMALAGAIELPDTAAMPANDCSGQRHATAGLVFVRPARAPVDAIQPVGGGQTSAWLQYRADASRSGALADTIHATHGWRARIDGAIRSSASAAGHLVLIGAHGTGSLTALDVTTGRPVWAVRVPNWIHQDAVTDGRIVVVGFGDNMGSFVGRAPSGVAAYELATGRHLWTSFDEGSVMTSPVIRDTTVLYATGAGILRKRVLATGRLLGERMLPGTVTMAPPASVGDTIVFTLDHNHTCALLISTLGTLWCRDIPNLRLMGHASPSIANGRVIVSGAAALLSLSVGEFMRLPAALEFKLIRSVLFPDGYEEYAGQRFASIDLHTGKVAWISQLFANPRLVLGHIAGTATWSGPEGVIVLPISDTLVAFDAATGRVRWTAHGLNSRGPPLIIGDRVVLTGRDGTIEVRRLADGAPVCTLHRTVGFDRAGPTRTSDLVIVADLNGGVEAIPVPAVLTCTIRESP